MMRFSLNHVEIYQWITMVVWLSHRIFILHYNPEQFEILGITDRDNNSGQKTKVYTKSDAPNYSDLNRRGVLKVGSSYKLCWPTIIIRKKIVWK